MHLRTHHKIDGRRLLLYGTAPHTLSAFVEPARAGGGWPHLRWHPLRSEWAAYAPHRQDRTFLPVREFCPLCPTRPDRTPTEIPFSDFEVAVFENRFPAFIPNLQEAPAMDLPTRPASGACEVVVYTSEHEGSAASLSQERRELLVRVWSERYCELYGPEPVQYVMPFENRGETVGVTLHHPHGQIYAYPFVPPVLQREVEAFRKTPVLQELLGHLSPTYVVTENDVAVATVPPFARFPYEVWIIPKRSQPGPWTFEAAEVAGYARMWGEVVSRYDALFGRPFPYVMVLHAAPKGEESSFHFHTEFYPLQRTANRLKYLAGTELGAGTFTVDVMPEDAARALREAQP